MEPISIATVAKITTTCLTTGKAIWDICSKYRDAPRTLVTIASEVSVISASLSQIQAILVSKDNPEQLLRTRPEVATTLDTALTGCMVLFSCLGDEVREVSRHARGIDQLSWFGKARTVWKQETLQELLEAIRGQQIAITTLIQLLQMDSLTEIKQLLQRNAPEIKKTIERTNTIRRSYPSVRVAESIYSEEDRLSTYSAADSVFASSDIEFDFDDIVINSVAYRRALAAARQQSGPSTTEVEEGDLIDLSDSNTIREAPKPGMQTDEPSHLADLLSVRFSFQLDETQLAAHNDLEPSLSTQDPADDALEVVRVSSSRALGGGELRSPPLPDQSNRSRARSPSLQPKYHSSTPPLRPGHPGAGVSDGFKPPTARICGKCEKELTGQFVRALGSTYHIDCFTCQDCDKVVASKFFAVGDPPNSYPLCEVDYFRRLDLLCYGCGCALRGSYVTALDRKYHLEHFKCEAGSCSVVFGPTDSYYEHENRVYCLKHYASVYARPCEGCELPVLKQFVEIFRNGQNQQWHPECYMIHKYWNCKLSQIVAQQKPVPDSEEWDVAVLSGHLAAATDKVSRVWSVLSVFEEKTALVISHAILEKSKGSERSVIGCLAGLLSMIGTLFEAFDSLAQRRTSTTTPLDVKDYSRKAKLLCKKTVEVMRLVANSSEHVRSSPNPITQDFLSGVTGIAHYLKLCIRIGLKAACQPKEIDHFLSDMAPQNWKRGFDRYKPQLTEMAMGDNDTCVHCQKPVEDACFVHQTAVVTEVWHERCFRCPHCHQPGGLLPKKTLTAQTFEISLCRWCGTSPSLEPNTTHVPRHRYYVYLLWVALARLCKAALLSDVDVSTLVWENIITGSETSSGAEDASSVAAITLDDIPARVDRLSKGM